MTAAASTTHSALLAYRKEKCFCQSLGPSTASSSLPPLQMLHVLLLQISLLILLPFQPQRSKPIPGLQLSKHPRRQIATTLVVSEREKWDLQSSGWLCAWAGAGTSHQAPTYLWLESESLRSLLQNFHCFIVGNSARGKKKVFKITMKGTTRKFSG